MPAFPDRWMSELLAKCDIASIIGEYVPLSAKGRRLWGCCPFHQEKTPSFSVSPDKQLYYCFGCHAGGTVIQFVMEMEKLPFVEAVRFLARRANMELPGEADDESVKKDRAMRERLYQACKDAALFYHRTLAGEQGAEGRAYLTKRLVSGSVIRKFGLGYAPDGWTQLTAHMMNLGYKPDELIKSGLAVKGARPPGCYDAFRGRVIFPIIATTGRVIAFGARALNNETPKYINTGDTPIFNKRANLYGLNLLKGRTFSDLIMVEGYMDVISLLQYGVDNAVASLGTALTRDQARLMKRYANTVYISYDGDSAGQAATLRGLDILEKEGLKVKVIRIPGGLDPDEFIKRRGKEAFLSLKDEALSLPGFRIEHMAANANLKTEDGREEFAKRACAFIGTLQPVEQDRYYAVVARLTGLPIQAVKAQGGISSGKERNSFPTTRYNRVKMQERADNARDKCEQTLLACMLKGREHALYLMGAMDGAEFFDQPAYIGFSSELLAQYVQSETADVPLILSLMPPEEAERVVPVLELSQTIADPRKTIDDCIKNIRRMLFEDEISALGGRFDKCLDAEEKQRILKQMEQLQKKISELK